MTAAYMTATPTPAAAPAAATAAAAMSDEGDGAIIEAIHSVL
jgi:hypothetical protein